MKKINICLVIIATLAVSCTKISDYEVNKEVAINIGKTVQSATKELIPADTIGSYNLTTSWKGGTVEINGNFTGNGIGEYTIKFTNITFEHLHKEGKKEWKSVINQNGTIDVQQVGNVVNAESSVYSSNGTVSIKKKEKKHSGSGEIIIKLSENGNTANIYGNNITF